MMTAIGKWKVAGYLTAIFAAGMVSGWVVAGREAKTNPHPPHPQGPGPFSGRPSTNTIYQVGLNAEQKLKVDAILARYGKMWEDRRTALGNEMRKESSNRLAELTTVLTPEQLLQWEKIRKDRDAAWRSNMNSGRGGSNSTRGSEAGDKDKGERGRGRPPRDRRGPDGTNPAGARGVTSPPGARSTSPPAPPP